MATTATRTITIVYSGDTIGTQSLAAASNTTSPGAVTIQTLASGFNTITLPSTTGVVVKSVTILPPASNTQTMVLKGVTGDTGVGLHLTDPSTIALASTVTTIGITAGAEITNVKFFWV